MKTSLQKEKKRNQFSNDGFQHLVSESNNMKLNAAKSINEDTQSKSK